MTTHYGKRFAIPPKFPDILRDFTREVLRNQPQDIVAFAVEYFDCKRTGMPTKMVDKRFAVAPIKRPQETVAPMGTCDESN